MRKVFLKNKRKVATTSKDPKRLDIPTVGNELQKSRFKSNGRNLAGKFKYLS